MSAQFLFGAPLAGQPVRWWITRSPAREVPAPIRERYAEDQFAFGYLPRPETSGPLYLRLPERREPLTAEGRLSVSVPTEAGADMAFRYQLDADVEGVSGQHIANRAVTMVHPASFYVGLDTAAVLRQRRTRVHRRSRRRGPCRHRARECARDGLARARAVAIRAPAREPGVPGVGADRDPVGRVDDHDDDRSRVAADPACATAAATRSARRRKDERGRPTRTEALFYVLGRGYSAWRTDGNRITLTPERMTWKPGETARVLVQSPWERATALVTTEREGIRSHRRVAITSMQDAIDVPITEADVPNVYVSVLLVKGRTSADATADDSDPGKPGFRVGYTQLTVDDGSKRLKVDVKADKQEYRPRQEVAVSVTVADAQGRPRASEVTLWAMDYGLLSLTDYKTPDVARAIYARKQLQVQTQDNRARLIGRRPMLVESAGAGTPSGAGGGGRGGAWRAWACRRPRWLPRADDDVGESHGPSGLPDGGYRLRRSADLDVRRDFRPLAFWLGSVVDRRRRPRDGVGHAARLADDVPRHGGRGRSRVAFRRGRERDSRDQAAHDARGLPALHGTGRSRLLRRRRHQRHRPRRRRGRDDSQPGSSVAAIRWRTDADRAARAGRVGAGALRRDRDGAWPCARADDRDARRRDGRVRG